MSSPNYIFHPSLFLHWETGSRRFYIPGVAVVTIVAWLKLCSPRQVCCEALIQSLLIANKREEFCVLSICIFPCWFDSCKTSLLTFTEWNIPLITKRLNARYDWLNGHWDQKPYRLKDGGDGCSPNSSVAGAVAWVTDSGCSFFTKVCNNMYNQ